MISSFAELEKKYFDKPLSRGFVCLYAARAVDAVIGALLGIFIPIFLYKLFDDNLVPVVIYYGLGHLVYALTVFFGGKILSKFGFRRGLQVSTILMVIYYLILYSINPESKILFVSILGFDLLLFRLAHWVPYHTNFAKFTDDQNRGRQLSILKGTILFFGIIIPPISGWIIYNNGFKAVFMIAIIFSFLFGIPYLFIPKTKEKFSWSFKQTWSKFLSKDLRRIVLVTMSEGGESIIGAVVWPIFIFEILNGNYFQIGLLSGFITIFTIILQLILGKLVDVKSSKKGLLRIGTLLYSIGWFVKSFVATGFHIFVAGVYHNIAGVFLNVSYGTLTYELAADQGHYVDEFTIIREMGVNLGKFLMSVVILIVYIFFSIQWIFYLAAFVTLVFNILGKEEKKKLLSRVEL